MRGDANVEEKNEVVSGHVHQAADASAPATTIRRHTRFAKPA